MPDTTVAEPRKKLAIDIGVATIAAALITAVGGIATACVVVFGSHQTASGTQPTPTVTVTRYASATPKPVVTVTVTTRASSGSFGSPSGRLPTAAVVGVSVTVLAAITTFGGAALIARWRKSEQYSRGVASAQVGPFELTWGPLLADAQKRADALKEPGESASHDT